MFVMSKQKLPKSKCRFGVGCRPIWLPSLVEIQMHSISSKLITSFSVLHNDIIIIITKCVPTLFIKELFMTHH